jgi:formyltetrahydrofolate-dependent phosphoribosylglycinamide formyltransferase
MFESLQKKWQVKPLQLALIIATFAIGGSLTGYVARKLMPLLSVGNTALWIVVYVLLVTLLWPFAVLLISIPFGQYRFFTRYLEKMGRRAGLVKRPEAKSLHKIAIFASGAGSNAEKLIKRFKNHKSIRIALILCNKPGAGVLSIAKNAGIPTLLIEPDRFKNGDAYLPELVEKGINFIVLAGFLWKIPPILIKNYQNRIINIHPALLPKYGGKGMYGDRVHEAVISSRDTESGITIHFVDEIYDHGAVIFQARCPVEASDNSTSLAQKIHALEHEHFGRVVEDVLSK